MEVYDSFLDWFHGLLHLFSLEVDVQLERTQKPYHDFFVLLELVHIRVVNIVSQPSSKVHFLWVL